MEVLDCVSAINRLHLSPFVCFLHARIESIRTVTMFFMSNLINGFQILF